MPTRAVQPIGESATTAARQAQHADSVGMATAAQAASAEHPISSAPKGQPTGYGGMTVSPEAVADTVEQAPESLTGQPKGQSPEQEQDTPEGKPVGNSLSEARSDVTVTAYTPAVQQVYEKPAATSEVAISPSEAKATSSHTSAAAPAPTVAPDHPFYRLSQRQLGPIYAALVQQQESVQARLREASQREEELHNQYQRSQQTLGQLTSLVQQATAEGTADAVGAARMREMEEALHEVRLVEASLDIWDAGTLPANAEAELRRLRNGELPSTDGARLSAAHQAVVNSLNECASMLRDDIHRDRDWAEQRLDEAETEWMDVEHEADMSVPVRTLGLFHGFCVDQ